MGASLCNPKSTDQVNHEKIELRLRMDAEESKTELKILLLGAADSGKSTIVKQMRILHTDGFSHCEVSHFKHTLRCNLVDSLSHIARAIPRLHIQMGSQEERDLVRLFELSYDGQMCSMADSSTEELAEKVHNFLGLSSVRTACARLMEFYVPDNTEFLLTNAHRLLSADFRPSQEDIIQARASTKGIYEIHFSFQKFTIRLIDVGGQRTERRKWIHCFEGIAAILFIVSLSCYNQMTEDVAQISQMEDTFELFRGIYRNKFLGSSAIIMFLNKKDVFARKLPFVPLEQYYPAFQGVRKRQMDAKDLFQAAVKFFKHLFLSVNNTRDHNGNNGRTIYTHVTNATDTKNIDFVFTATCDIVVKRNFTKSGIY